jgi:branched-chain amino acid transport system ATP-binding protein
MTLLPEGRRVFRNMTVRENLEMGVYIRKDKNGIGGDIERIFDFFPQLKDRTGQKAGTLSGGEQQMLALGRSLMLKPKLLLADEPFLGLSPNYVDTIFDKLKAINKDGTSILLVEQNAMMALEVCHRAYVYEIGRIVLDGDRDSLVGDERVKKAYLGG